MNPFQTANDWYGLYAGETSRDDILMPRVRTTSERWDVWNEAPADGPEVVLRHGKDSWPLKKPRQVLTLKPGVGEALVQFVLDTELPVRMRKQQGALLDVESEDRLDPTLHPAKMANALLARIIETMAGWGWLSPGDVMVDMFGGTGRTAVKWCAMDARNRAATIEIEAHFVQMQQQVKAHAEGRLGRVLPWSIIHGDSRKADTLLSEAGVGITSPPYGEGVIGKGQDAAALLEKCPSLKGRNPNGAWFQSMANGYVNSPGNIDNLPDEPGRAGVSSPPYEGDQPCQSQTRVFAEHGYHGIKNGAVKRDQTISRSGVAVASPPYEGSLNSADPDVKGGLFNDPKRRDDRSLTATYGAGISSPPFETQSGGHPMADAGPLSDPRLHDRHAASKRNAATGYAENVDGQIGATEGETYASACLQCYEACARAGIRYLALVTKNPTRSGKLRRLDQLTARLLRQAGYRVVAWRRAWLWMRQEEVEALMGQSRMFADEVQGSQRPKGRLSFFRRLHLAKGAVAAMWEDVIFAVLDDGCGAAISSPPYEDSINDRCGIDTGKCEKAGSTNQGDHMGYSTAAGVASPPYEDTALTGQGRFRRDAGGREGAENPREGYAGVASPPYANTDTKPNELGTGKASRKGGDGAGRNKGDYAYPASEGQIGTLPDPEETASTRLYTRYWTLTRLKDERALTPEEQAERAQLAAQIDRKRGR